MASCRFLLFLALFVSLARGVDRPSVSAVQTRLTFLGTSTANPAAGEDTACFFINGTLLIDCGFNAALNMQRYGHEATKVETLFVTHFHHDHYMGLPSLLFTRGMRSRELVNRPPLQIVGPADDLPVVVELSRRFLQADRFPTVWPKVELRPLEPGQTYETDTFKIETVKAIHPVTGFCSRYTDKATGVVIAFSGDTNPNPAFARLARGADVLIHEASIGPTTPGDKIGKDHSRAIDAAHIARESGVKQLVLIHLSARQRDASLAAAKKVFANTIVAAEGQTIIFPSGSTVQ
jgi:ribonuclease Z